MQRLIACGLAALILLTGAAGAAGTTLYRWVDAQGIVHYSDTPQPGAQTIEVHSAQGYHAPPASRGSGQSSPGPAEQPPAEYECHISSPLPQQSFFSPETVAISVSVSPALVAGDQILVYVDGNPLPSSSGQDFQVNQPDRGGHTISATVRAADGRTACTAAPVTFEVQRPSLLSPTSPARGR
jgi:hypothetical protein